MQRAPRLHWLILFSLLFLAQSLSTITTSHSRSFNANRLRAKPALNTKNKCDFPRRTIILRLQSDSDIDGGGEDLDVGGEEEDEDISSFIDEEYIVEDEEEEEEDDFDDNDEDDDSSSSIASPMSQLRTDEEDALYRGTFVGNNEHQEWLEEATEEIFDAELLPLGSLTEDDVESITGLMATWVRRRSVEAALVVDRLLKRVVDDIRSGNPDIHVTAKMYTIAMDSWAKSGAEGGAQRAQQIHDGMIEMYKQTGDENIAPSVISYNTVMNAWCKTPDPRAVEMAEQVLKDMLVWNETNDIKPDAVTFSTLMDTYARSKRSDATQRAEELFEMMPQLGVKWNVYTFSALQNVYARSGHPEAPAMAMKVLERMLELCYKGDVFAKPNCVNYNSVLNAYSRTPSRESATSADEMLSRMELPASEGGYDVEPDRLSYALAILACARCPDSRLGARLAENNLEKMEARAKLEAQKREERSSAAPPLVALDIECFNSVLTAISRSFEDDAVERAFAIIMRMNNYAKEGASHVRPNTRSWNAVLHALSRSNEKGSAEKAEQILKHMFELQEKGVPNVKPDIFSFAAVLSATSESAPRAYAILCYMERLYEEGKIETPPDVYHSTIVCVAWGKSNMKEAPARCIEILSRLKARDAAGFPRSRPTCRTYNAVLSCLSKWDQGETAEQLLYHMIDLARKGDVKAQPDDFSFNSVIIAFTRGKQKDAGKRAEMVLDRFLEYSEDHPSVQPDSRSFTNIIAYYKRNTEMMDAPYRAEYVLNRMIALFKAGRKKLSPNVFAVTIVMDAYAKHSHPDAGECAERLLKLMIKLRDNYNAHKLEVNTGVMNCVLNAWAWSGDDNAGRRADMLLKDMEEKCLQGDPNLRPNARSYCHVMRAWAKSGVPEKAREARSVLDRMKRRHKEGLLRLRPGEHPYSLVVNACAFTNGSPDLEEDAFRIAVKTMTEMLESDDFEVTSTTYGWFLQCCCRLRIPQSIKDENVERAFKKCCDQGIVNEFVLNRLKVAASDTLLKKLLSPVLSRLNKNDREKDSLRDRIQLSLLPKHWTRKRYMSRSETPPVQNSK